MSTTPTLVELQNAVTDLNTLAQVVNGDSSQTAISLRLGGTAKSLRAIAALAGTGGGTATTDASQLVTGTLAIARLPTIPNTSLANSAVTINGTPVSLGGAINIATGSGGGSTVTQWNGKNIGYWGDSITTPDYHGDAWRNVVNSILGATQTFMDARVGRPLATMFDNYSGTTTTTTSNASTVINIFDPTAVKNNVLISDVDGTEVTGYNGFVSTDYMDLRGAPTIIANFQLNQYSNANAGLAFYNSSKAFLSGNSAGLASNTPLTVPAGAKYLRGWTATGGYTAGSSMIVTGSNIPNTFQAYDPSSQYGTGGTTTVTSTGTLTDGSGHTLAQNLAGLNLMVVWLGTNDHGDTLGSPTDPSSAATFYGYMQFAAQQLHAANPTMRVAWITPYQYNTGAYTAGAGGSPPSQLADFVTAMKYVAGLYGDTVIDLLHESGINQYNWNTYLIDGIHPNYTTTSLTLLGPLIANRLLRVF